MRYRKQSSDGDFQFGHGSADFWRNAPDAVGQAIKTRLLLFRGEWFLDLSEGTPWGGFPFNDLVVSQGQILGAHTQLTRDLALKERILDTPGVLTIIDYSSSFDSSDRSFNASMKVDTIYGAVSIRATQTSQGSFSLDVSPLDSGPGLG
jgi:hypothetical protein